MIENWLHIDESDHGERKRLFLLSEREGGRVAVHAELTERVRAHYDDPQRVADDIADLGFSGAAAILRERLPTRKKSRSGELGEIIATEFMEHHTGFRFPVRRLRYKDGREMALRGDDFLGIEEVDRSLNYLKGESKSGQAMGAAVIADARARLNEDDGRPTPISLLFVADRLMEGNAEDQALGRKIRNAVGRGAVRSRNVTHGLFTLTGKDRRADLETDLNGADDVHGHISVNLWINDHPAFIAWVYEEAENLGDD